MVEGVEMFSYLGRNLYQTDDDWSKVRQNVIHARLVWGKLGTLLQREGVDPRVEAMFYWLVVKATLL